MKKTLLVALCVLMIVVLCGCSTGGFMPRSQVNSLVKKYGTPEAKVTISYVVNNKTIKLDLFYDLLLDKTPITVVNFINLVEAGYYNNTLIDTNLSGGSSHYMIGGRYYAKDFEETDEEDRTQIVTKYFNCPAQPRFVGEFQSNFYKAPKATEKGDDGYSKFEMFSLAMYHGANVEDFDNANGAIIISTSQDYTLNYKNYAVFAHLTGVEISIDGGESTPYTKVPSYVVENLMDISRSYTRPVYESEEEGAKSTSVLICTANITIESIEMLGNSDWSKLPKNYVIAD
ncbi:MAG: peptidylprolyl isomerase [Clostridia bacterium]|nr:peptidylprolyl isomerase [Clostridia bacterium]